jgi:thioredoxin-related protein
VPRQPLSVLALLLFGWVFFLGGRAAAQDVRWRTDYAAARKEASDSGKPLLLDFGTEACFYCKKLDATTFRDPKVAKLLNERFVAVKIDAQKEERLATALRIESYPTLLMATADGKVIGRHVGYADAAQLTAFLTRAIPLAPAALIAPPSPPTKAESQQRRSAEFDAGLAALFPEIAARLDR